jgi:hypothetical protein
MADPTTREQQIQSLVGNRLGPYNSFNAVNRVQIWQWCSAMGDNNPLYLDDEYRQATEFSRVVAPPAMMQMWTMRDFNDRYAPGSTDDAPYRVFDDMTAMGYGGNVAVSYDLTFHRYLEEGERPLHYTTVVNISDRKTTALGEGYFVTERVEYLTQAGSAFAEALITYFQYKPAAQSSAQDVAEVAVAEAPSKDEQSPAWTPDFTTLSPYELEPGQALPELHIPITHRLIVGGAIATQDFIPVHHNVPAAQAAAMPDIFMNILTTNGLSARYLSDWAGAGSRLKKMQFRLMAPNLPGDSMAMSGAVRAVSEVAQGADVTVAFEGNNSRGTHVVGEAVLWLPR